MLTKQDISTGRAVATALGAYVGGSVLVDEETANDFDIFIGASAFAATKHNEYSFTVPVVRSLWGEDWSGTITFVDSFDSRSDYYRSNNEDNALRCTYRSTCGKYNLIVVEDDFLLAFKISANIMVAHPNKYKTREARVELHHHQRSLIRTWLSDSFAMSYHK